MTKSQLIEESKRRFDLLDIQISPPKTLAEEELREKIMLFLPIAFDLLKPSIRNFLGAELHLIYDKAVEEMREKIEQYPEKLKSIMPEGKLPFVVFQGKATEEEKWVIYSQAFKDILSTLTPKGEK